MSKRCKTCGQPLPAKAMESLSQNLARQFQEQSRKPALELTNLFRTEHARFEGRMRAPIVDYVSDLSDEELLAEIEEENYRNAIEDGLRLLVDARTANNVARHPDAPDVMKRVQAALEGHAIFRDDSDALKRRVRQLAAELTARGIPKHSHARIIGKKERRSAARIRQILNEPLARKQKRK